LLYRVLFAPWYRACRVSSFPLWPWRFCLAFAVFPAAPAPEPLRVRVHPLVSFGPSSEYVIALRLLADRSRRAPPWVLLSIATQVLGVHLPVGFSSPPTFRPQCIAHSRRFAPPRTLQACFILLPRPRLLFRGFSRYPAGWLITSACPLVVDAARLLPSYLGGSSSWRLAFRALIRLPVRCSRQVF